MERNLMHCLFIFVYGPLNSYICLFVRFTTCLLFKILKILKSIIVDYKGKTSVGNNSSNYL